MASDASRPYRQSIRPVLDDARLREIGDLLRYQSSVSFTSYRAAESVKTMHAALIAVLGWVEEQGCSCDESDLSPEQHHDECAGRVEYLLRHTTTEQNDHVFTEQEADAVKSMNDTCMRRIREQQDTGQVPS